MAQYQNKCGIGFSFGHFVWFGYFKVWSGGLIDELIEAVEASKGPPAKLSFLITLLISRFGLLF